MNILLIIFHYADLSLRKNLQWVLFQRELNLLGYLA